MQCSALLKRWSRISVSAKQGVTSSKGNMDVDVQHEKGMMSQMPSS